MSDASDCTYCYGIANLYRSKQHSQPIYLIRDATWKKFSCWQTEIFSLFDVVCRAVLSPIERLRNYKICMDGNCRILRSNGIDDLNVVNLDRKLVH